LTISGWTGIEKSAKLRSLAATLAMSRMDRLYGAAMIERGVSQLVSVDLTKAEQLVAAQ